MTPCGSLWPQEAAEKEMQKLGKEISIDYKVLTLWELWSGRTHSLAKKEIWVDHTWCGFNIYIYVKSLCLYIYIYISIVYIYIYIRIHRFWCSPIFGRMIPNDPSVSDGLLHRCHRWPSRRGMWKLVSCRPVRRERGGKVLLDLHSSILDWMSHDESLCYWLKQLAFHCETIGGLNI